MIIGANSPPPSINSLLASSFAAPDVAAQNQAMRMADASVRADASRAQASAGAGATSSVQYSYSVGPDGQLYATSATISSSKRTNGPRDPLTPLAQQESAPAQPLAVDNRQPPSLAALSRPQAHISPSDEAAIFGSPDFMDDIFNSNESLRRARLQLADFGVRAQEGQHFKAAAGLGDIPEYDLIAGPDGELFAVAGSVSISGGPTTSDEDAAAQAATIARAALAATDVSAQDVSVARDAQFKAASLYAANARAAERETPLFQLVG